jgi:outer membrane protein assembly factor BamA
LRYSLQVLLFLLLCNRAAAQRVELVLSGPDADTFRRLSRIPGQFEQIQEAIEALEKARMDLWGKGYLSFSADSIKQDENRIEIWPFVGKRYTWARLSNGNIPANILSQYRFDPGRYFGRPVQPKDLYPFYNRLLTHYEENGFPFARLYLDSLNETGGQTDARLMLDTGPLTRLDTVILHEGSPVSRGYIMRYLGLKQKGLYNESRITAISTRIREIPFLAEAAPWRLDFNIAKTTLNLYLKNRSANRADVLIGLLPSNAEIGGKFLLTGDIKLAFVNTLGQGEQLQLNWQNLQYRSPRYDVQFSLPYLLNTPIGISGRFDFYKKDTTFRTTNGELGLVYAFNSQSQVKVYYNLSGSRLSSVNTALLLSTRALPANGDATYRTFGAEGIWSRLDFRQNPRRGYRLSINGSLSLRRMIRNATIENTWDPNSNRSFAYLYDSLALNSYRYNVVVQAHHYNPLGKRFVLAKSYSGALAYSTNPLFRNELFQIGGFRLLRGFDEGSLFLSQYHVLTLEPRFLLSSSSYFFLFGDAAYTESRYLNTDLRNWPYAFGAGMVFETKGGLFNLSYAVGATQNLPLQLRSSKIHFGYVNFF